MNLKEAFRYQSFLEKMMNEAEYSLIDSQNLFRTSKKHLRNAANPDAEDFEEEVDISSFFEKDVVIAVAEMIITERQRIAEAITAAKSELEFDVDAAISANKFRQRLCNCISTMTSSKPKSGKESGYDYRLNVNGDQVPYRYEIEVKTEDAFDRKKDKFLLNSLRKKSDDVSYAVDVAMVTANVEYIPMFDVNMTFDDIVTECKENSPE